MSDDELSIPATLIRREKYAPSWGVLLAPVETIVSFLPSHRATKTSRTNAKQIRVGLVVLGVAIIAFGGTIPWILIGAVIMASALILPLSEVTKRAWRGRLRRLRTQQVRDAKTDGSIVYDNKRLILYEDDTKLRRVLIDRGEHRVEHRRLGEAACLGVLPPSGRKAESIWICAPDRAVSSEDIEEINRGDVDIWVHVAPNDWEQIHDLLNK